MILPGAEAETKFPKGSSRIVQGTSFDEFTEKCLEHQSRSIDDRQRIEIRRNLDSIKYNVLYIGQSIFWWPLNSAGRGVCVR